jgi:hypothetical protein
MHLIPQTLAQAIERLQQICAVIRRDRASVHLNKRKLAHVPFEIPAIATPVALEYAKKSNRKNIGNC